MIVGAWHDVITSAQLMTCWRRHNVIASAELTEWSAQSTTILLVRRHDIFNGVKLAGIVSAKHDGIVGAKA